MFNALAQDTAAPLFPLLSSFHMHLEGKHSSSYNKRVLLQVQSTNILKCSDNQKSQVPLVDQLPLKLKQFYIFEIFSQRWLVELVRIVLCVIPRPRSGPAPLFLNFFSPKKNYHPLSNIFSLSNIHFLLTNSDLFSLFPLFSYFPFSIFA